MISSESKKILLVQLFSNGDCLYATTVARQIKYDFPKAHLTWAIADFCKDIIDYNPYVDEKMIVTEVKKNDVSAFRKFRSKVLKQKKEGRWDDVFITMNMDNNQALYDGTIRGMILKAYPYPVTVPVQPVLVLSEQEKLNVTQFVTTHKLADFKNVILWEFAAQSGQATLSLQNVMHIAAQLSLLPSTCVILTSAHTFTGTARIIDASILSIRENAALTHYCNLLIGCSSGITWLSTSTAGKLLPMVQILDPNAAFMNAPSVDFERFNIQHNGLIEMSSENISSLNECIKTIIISDFKTAEKNFHQPLPLQFNTTRKVVYNMLCYLQFNAIAKHYKTNVDIYGKNADFIKQFILGIITFPIKLASNIYHKNIKARKQIFTKCYSFLYLFET